MCARKRFREMQVRAADTRMQVQSRGGADLARVSGQIGSSTERKRRGSATKSPSCLGHRVPSAIAVALAGCTSRRGNNAAHYCRLALSSAGFSTPAIARSNDVTRMYKIS